METGSPVSIFTEYRLSNHATGATVEERLQQHLLPTGEGLRFKLSPSSGAACKERQRSSSCQEICPWRALLRACPTKCEAGAISTFWSASRLQKSLSG